MRADVESLCVRNGVVNYCVYGTVKIFRGPLLSKTTV
jgi:hypothetical protein